MMSKDLEGVLEFNKLLIVDSEIINFGNMVQEINDAS